MAKMPTCIALFIIDNKYQAAGINIAVSVPITAFSDLKKSCKVA